jgi:hypothetical protein
MNVVNFIGDLIALIGLFSIPIWLPVVLEVLL